MPMIEVKLYDHRVTDEAVPKMIEKLTDALAESSGAAKEHIQVVIQGVPPKHWGIAGKPAIPQCFGGTPWITTWMCSFAAPLDSARASVSFSIIFGTASSVTRWS